MSVYDSSPFVGTWNVSLDFAHPDAPAADAADLSRLGLATLHADGTVVASAAPLYAMPDGAPWPRVAVGTVHGAWEPTSERAAMIAVRAILRDESGEHLGALDFYLRGELSDDDRTLTGTYSTFVAVGNAAWAWADLPRGSVVARRFRVAPPG